MTSISNILHRRLIFIEGKGGVGKTTIAHAVALSLSNKGKRTLLISIEDPMKPGGELVRMSPTLWHLNCEASTAFEEYAAMKIGMPVLTRIFLKNKLMRYLARAAPGIHDLVLLGKIWHERTHYDHVVVDMPSTGHGITLFQSTFNFARLFKGGPIHHDAVAMLKTFNDPGVTGQLIVALPEEMPLREGIELKDYLVNLFPKNNPAFLVNRVFPKPLDTGKKPTSNEWTRPIADSSIDWLYKRAWLEDYNLRIWREAGIPIHPVGFVPPPEDLSRGPAVLHQEVADLLEKGGCL